jgi:hypothetical protein
MNGKGDAPRNCFSKQFKDNYDSIDWGSASKRIIARAKESGIDVDSAVCPRCQGERAVPGYSILGDIVLITCTICLKSG